MKQIDPRHSAPRPASQYPKETTDIFISNPSSVASTMPKRMPNENAITDSHSFSETASALHNCYHTSRISLKTKDIIATGKTA
jgi:hypothetical protein